MKIDTTKIAGYSDMSAEQKLKALEDFEYEPEKIVDNTEIEKLKNALSKSNSEAAEYKKQLREKQTDAEANDAEKERLFSEMKTELDSLRKEKNVSDLKSKFLGLGYSEELASQTAVAMAEGKTDIVFSNQKAFLDLQKSEYEKNALNNQPGLSTGKTPSGTGSENLENLEMADYIAARNKMEG